MDRDGVETGPEVKVPIYTYRKLASKHANFIWIQMKLRFHIKIINLKFLVPFKCFDFYISILQTPLKEFSTPELQNLIEKVEKLYDG